MKRLAISCFIAAGLMTGAASAAMAAGSAHFASAPAAPNATAPALVVNFVVAGASDPNGKVPAFNAVPGSGVANLSIADPESYIISNARGLTFSVASNVITLPANTSCTTAITITGASKLLFAGKTKPYIVGPQTVWLYAFNTNRPAYSGSAQMTGKVACSGPAGKASATLKAPLIFQ